MVRRKKQTNEAKKRMKTVLTTIFIPFHSFNKMDYSTISKPPLSFFLSVNNG